MVRLLSKIFFRLDERQEGATSLYLSLIVMVILSLMAFGFAQIAGTNYRQIAESQYNLLSHYGAESAINQVRGAIHDSITHTSQVANSDNLSVEKTSGSNSLTNPAGGFGSAVFISGDLLIVGAPTANGGKGEVYVYEKSGADWHGATLTATVGDSTAGISLTAGDAFGASVVLSRGQLAVGAPGGAAVYLISPERNFRNKINTADVPGGGGTDFGSAVALHGAGNGLRLLIGAPGVGKIHLFSFTDLSNVAYEREIKPADVSIGTVSGFGTALSAHSNLLAVGADNVAYVLERQGSNWSLKATVSNPDGVDLFGASVSLDSSLLLVGAPGGDDGHSDAGAVYAFERQGSSWEWKHRISEAPSTDSQFSFDLTANENFGRSVSLDGNKAAVGAPGSNTAYFFKIASNDILNDIWAADLDQDCPSQEDAHPAWRNNVVLADEDTGETIVEYLCVSVEVAPLEVLYDNIGLERSLVFGLEAVDSSYNDVNLNELTLEWNHANTETAVGLASVSPPGSFSSQAGWGSRTIPLLRAQISIVNLDQGFSRETMNKNSRVFYLYPDATGGSADWLTDGGKVIGGDCDVNRRPFACQMAFNLPLPTDAGLEQVSTPPPSLSDRLVYAVRIQSFYNEARLQITGKHGTSSDEAQFKNLQAVITATGRSNNVLERLRERIPLRPVYDLPEYAIDSAGNLCKILAADDSSGVYLFVEEPYDNLGSEPACSLTP
ncbi:hypothetical protein F4X86_03330 [Candidatus Saccharibacteria bacterium]|nr:hypothetical protein [Candidatus Saccharibacteria bacterium]